MTVNTISQKISQTISPEVNDKISSGISDENGRFANYIKISDEFGIKYWKNQHVKPEEVRDGALRNFYAGIVLFELKIGPKVWGFQKIDEETYGYFTEHVEELGIVDVIDARNELKEQIYGNGYRLEDLCRQNMGVLNEKWVVLDAGCLVDIKIDEYDSQDASFYDENVKIDWELMEKYGVSEEMWSK
jgi:hypothetical protein